MDVDNNNIITKLIAEGPDFESTWADFVFNIPKLKQLQDLEKNRVMELLHRGLQFAGGGLNTGTLSKKLFQISGVAMVKGHFGPYRDAWLLAIALLHNVELPQLEAPPDVAEAAFAITSALEPEEWQEEPGEELSPDEPSFDWDEPTVPLPRELQELWNRSTRPDLKIDVKSLLATVPRFTTLPPRAPENNLLHAGRRKADGVLRAASQTVLHSLRVLAANYVKDVEPQQQGRANLQVWQVLAELYQRLQA
jgi:hypothetical protein